MITAVKNIQSPFLNKTDIILKLFAEKSTLNYKLLFQLLLRKSQTVTIMEVIKMHKKPPNSEVINDNGDIDKTFGDECTTDFRKYNRE